MNDLSLTTASHATAHPLVAAGALDLSRRLLPGTHLELADPDHV